MDLQLAGKRALITGSTSGIGFATARSLAGEGVEVILNGRGRAGVSAAVERLREAVPGASVRGIAADISTASAHLAPLQLVADFARTNKVDLRVAAYALALQRIEAAQLDDLPVALPGAGERQ